MALFFSLFFVLSDCRSSPKRSRTSVRELSKFQPQEDSIMAALMQTNVVLRAAPVQAKSATRASLAAPHKVRRATHQALSPSGFRTRGGACWHAAGQGRLRQCVARNS